MALLDDFNFEGSDEMDLSKLEETIYNEHGRELAAEQYEIGTEYIVHYRDGYGFPIKVTYMVVFDHHNSRKYWQEVDSEIEDWYYIDEE